MPYRGEWIDADLTILCDKMAEEAVRRFGVAATSLPPLLVRSPLNPNPSA